YSGDAASARTRFMECLSLSRPLGDSWITSGGLLGLGHAARMTGDGAAAHRYYAESLALSRKSKGNWELHVFEALAALAVDEGQLERATHLVAVSHAFREAIGLQLFPFLQPEHDRVMAAAQRGLDAHTFAAAWNSGRSQSLDQAVA